MLWDKERGKELKMMVLIQAGHYIARPFNFFVSPVVDPMFGIDRSVLSQASAMEMLCREGMNFNRIYRSGIRYLSIVEEAEIRQKEKGREEREKWEPVTFGPDDIEFLSRAMSIQSSSI